MIQPAITLAKTIVCTSAIAIVAAIGCITPSLAADRYALLVGVSAYPTLKDELQLRGPQNDVVLMRDLLKTQGFADNNIRVVANGVASANASPTRLAILAELKAVADRAKTGDFVYLQFGGHGSQQPTRPGKVNPEPDGLDEIFLPVDIGPWDGSVGSVKNAIRDDELGLAIDAIRQKGAFVWAVFDACHSGNITRGGSDDETRLRKAEPSALGIPQKLLDQAQDDAVIKTRGAPASNTPEKRGALSASQSSSPAMGGYVYFYAAQTTETTPEKPLPAGNPERKPYGVFTYTLAQVITTNPGISYRQASERVLQLYAAQNLRGVTPVFEGSGIDAPLFGQKAGEPVRQWRVTTTSGGVEIQAGNLHQFGVGAIFAVLPNAASKDTDAVGYLKAEKVDVVKSTLSPTKYADKAEIALADLPRDAVVRLVNRNVSMTLKVSLPSEKPSKPIYASTLRLLDQLKSTANDGLKIEWVNANQTADARLALADDQLWFVSPDGAWIKTGQNKTPSITLAKKSDDELRAIVLASLQSIGKANNLFKVGSLSGGSTSGLSDKVDAKFLVDGVFARTTIVRSKSYLGQDILNNIIAKRDPNTDYYTIAQDQLFKGGNICLTAGGVDEILERIRNNNLELKNHFNVYKGIETGANTVYIFDGLPDFYEKLNKDEKLLFKAFYKCSDIQKYSNKLNKKYILYIRNNYDLSLYPNILDYLNQHKQTLQNRAQIRRSRQNWFGLLWARDESLFLNDAIIAPYRSEDVSFSFSKGNFYSGTDTYFVVNPNSKMSLKMVLGILNSRLATKWFKTVGKNKGNILDMTGDNIENLPIPTLDTTDKQELARQIEVLVEQILMMKSNGLPRQSTTDTPSTKGNTPVDDISQNGNFPGETSENPTLDGVATQMTEVLESQIDQLVYQLYDLTTEEIGVVEGN